MYSDNLLANAVPLNLNTSSGKLKTFMFSLFVVMFNDSCVSIQISLLVLMFNNFSKVFPYCYEFGCK